MANKQFAERLNRELDAIGVPLRNDERIDAFAKLLHVPKFKAEAYLNGLRVPDLKLVSFMADEFEVNPDWLLGKSNHRHTKESDKSRN